MSEPVLDPIRLLSTWAADGAALADALAQVDPSWGSETFPLAGGVAVLCGPGMYVNRAMGAGIGRGLTVAEWERLERRSAVVGVRPEIELSRCSHPETRRDAEARGYTSTGVRSALVRDSGAAIPDEPSGFVIEPADGELLGMWQETSAQGFGALEPDRRRVNDAFARAVAMVDRGRLVIVLDPDDRRPVATASLTVRNGVATLGGMSTVPAERGRGVQSALIRHRVCVAHRLGCDVIASTAEQGSQSERNLIRHGFRPVFELEFWSRPE